MRPMAGFVFFIWLAVLPAFLLVLLFLRLDRARPEPRGLIVRAVLYGLAAIIPAALIEILLDRYAMPLVPDFPLLRPAVQAFLAVALVEEGIKYLFIKRFLGRPEFDEVMDGIVYAICVSMGFAFLENLIYGFGAGTGVLILRGLTAVPLHAAATGVMGYYLGQAKRQGRVQGQARGLAWAVGIHGLYDFAIFAGGWFPILLLPVIAASLLFLARLTKAALAQDRAEAARLDFSARSVP